MNGRRGCHGGRAGARRLAARRPTRFVLILPALSILAGMTPAQERGGAALPQMTRPRSAAQVYEFLDGSPFRQLNAVHYDAGHGEIFVVDSGNALIGIFDHRGVPRFTFAPGGRFDFPLAVDTDAEGNIYVLTAGEQEIRVFDYRGAPVRRMPIETVEKIRPSVAGFRLGSDGRLYLLDTTGHRILVREPDGTLVRVIRGSGRGGARLQAPIDLGFDGEGNLYVTDASGTPVQVYDPFGRYLRGWGEREIGPGNFSTPSGIGVDPAGLVFVADAVRQEIKVFDLQGTFMVAFGGFGGAPGDLAYPVDVAVGPEGRLIVAERVGRRFQVFLRSPGAGA